MNSLQVFVVFHKNLNINKYENFDSYKNLITFYGVKQKYNLYNISFNLK